MSNFITESNNIPVIDECDVLVVGGGSAGHSAALAAARAGAKKVIIMERYGYMGGDVTGGYVIMVPKLSWYDKMFVRGIQEEWFERMKNIPNAVLGPEPEDIGCTDPARINRWRSVHGSVSESEPHRLVRAVYFEPNQLKIEMDKMLLEERDRIHILYHCLGTKPIMEGNAVKGVIFESKEGRQAVLAKSVIDATGDGDIFRQTGTPFRALSDSNTRSNCTALVWRIGGINWDAFVQWQKTNPEVVGPMYAGLSKITGFRCAPLPSSDNSVCWINNWQSGMDCSKIKDITETELRTRSTMREVVEYLREVCPIAFRNAYLYDIAPQLGSRCSYRLQGEYIMTPSDFAFANRFDDVIAWHSTICRINDCGPVEIPYRAILPKGVENLLCPGRHISADDVAIDWVTLIPQCVGTGQAAGVAAAVAAQQGVSVRDVDIRRVQDILIEQNVPLPRNPKVDPSYTECCEAHEYGLYTDLAKKAKTEGIADYRQW
ncbi:MAG: FAD-dependent oxidoreductase [Clostridiales bacterium]|nr:FAD-dependent oxidoreductase [Clostridiales bacterium]